MTYLMRFYKMVEIVKEYSGFGKFKFSYDKDIIVDSNFSLNQYSDGKIIINCEVSIFSQEYVEIMNMNGRGLINVSMGGEVKNPQGKMIINRAFIDKLTTKFNKADSIATCSIVLKSFDVVELNFLDDKEMENLELHSGLTNFIFGGCERYDTGKGGFRVDRFRCKIKNFEAIFVQKEDYKRIADELKEKKGKLVTSEIIINFSIKEESKIKEILDNVTMLLSYSTRTLVSPIYEDYFNEDKLVKTRLKPILTTRYNHRSQVISSDHLGNCHTKEFLELVYDKYTKLKKELGFDVVIGYYLESSIATYLEMRFLLGFVCLECLLGHFEEKLKEEGNPLLTSSIKMNKSKIMKVLQKKNTPLAEDLLDEIVKTVSYPSPFLNDKLQELIRKYNINQNKFDDELNQIRNKIVHIGKFPNFVKSGGNDRTIKPLEEYHRLIYFLDRIILTLLGYSEKPFQNVLNCYKEEKLSQ